jgi:hypothetical protein
MGCFLDFAFHKSSENGGGKGIIPTEIRSPILSLGGAILIKEERINLNKGGNYEEN